MQLKNYQQQTIESLEFFCEEYSRTGLIVQAFQDTRKKFELPTIPYAEYENLNVPSVCFRIPTGGGKTFLAVQSIPVIVKKLFNTDSSLIFWVAPTTPIIQQTIRALKDPRHPYRQFLEQSFKGRTVSIMTIAEAHSKAFDLSTELPIIVSTIQTFGTENEEARKFFKENGVYQEFFNGTDTLPSLANAVKQANPIIIMDEAHNAKTDLRVAKLIDLNPSFMLELTATPQLIHNEAAGQYASNILYTVSASQLKAEDMIKLPIIVETIDKWELVLAETVNKRNELEQIALLEEQETGQYIRPMVLYKAEADRGEKSITATKILETLMNDFGIKREHIALDTGDYDDLKNVDLMARGDIRYVITVERLKEGWDAPFAYILGAIGEMRSSTAVEQILGRVLRLPYASQKSQPDLEKAYAFIASSETVEVINNLKDTLVDNGFERLEAEIHISSSRNSNKDADIVLSGLFAEPNAKIESFDITAIPTKYKSSINYNKDTKEFTILKRIPDRDLSDFVSSLKKAISCEEEKALIDEIIIVDSMLTNFRGLFSIPKLMANTPNGLFEFEKSVLLETISWNEQILIQNAKLSESEFSISFRKDISEINISDRSRIEIRKLESVKHNLFSLNGDTLKLSEADIVRLVLSHITSSDMTTLKITQLKKFILLTIHDLINNRNISTIELKANIHLLSESISSKIKNLEASVIKKQYDSLFEQEHFFEVNTNNVFTFDPDNYPTSSPIADTGMFKKHYYKLIDKMNGEETSFASYIDGLPEVEFWVRNIERNPNSSFWLQTSTDKFYPDFIIKLTNGKILVVEYKGEDRRTNDDTKEKTALGETWAKLTHNAGFAMVFKNDFKEKILKLLKD